MNHRLTSKTSWPVLLLLACALLLASCTPDPEPEAGDPTPTQTQAPTRPPPVPPTKTPQPTSLAGGSVTLPLAPPETNCTYSIHYWASNPDQWLTDNIVIGRFTYTKPDALAIFHDPSEAEASTLILKYFFAAALNILKGADPSAVEAVMADTSAWISAHPPGVELSNMDQQQAVQLAQQLRNFNAGQTGPGVCEDEPPTPTPTRTPTATLTQTGTPTRPGPTWTPTATRTPRGNAEPEEPEAPVEETEAPDTDEPEPQPTDTKPPPPTATKADIPTEAPIEPTAIPTTAETSPPNQGQATEEPTPAADTPLP